MSHAKIILFILFLFVIVGCSSSDRGSPPVVEDFELTSEEAPIARPAGNACTENDGHPCPPENCSKDGEGETLAFSAGTNNVCCAEPCKGAREIETTEGNKEETCAAQKAYDCGETKTCPGQQWIRSQDVGRCCKAECIERVQTTATIAGFGDIIIERLGEGKFGVFYGNKLTIGSVDLGRASFALARSVGNGEYEFTTTDKQTFRFKITKETESDIKAEGISPPPSSGQETGCKTYDLPKGDAGPKVVRLNVPKQCMGKQCLLRLKLIGAPPTPNLAQTQRQILFTQIDNQISLEGEPSHPISQGFRTQVQQPTHGINGDDQMLTILQGPGGCFLYDDYPNLEQTKEKMVYMPMPKSPYFCQLEVC